MRLYSVAALGAAALLWAAAGGRADAQAVAPEMFGALPTVSEAEISPNGQYVAMLQAVGKASAVVIYDLANPGSQPTGVGLGEVRARGIEWADDNFVLLLASQSYNLSTASGIQTVELWRWLSISRAKAKASILFGNEGGYYIGDPGTLLATTPETDGDAVFSRWAPYARGADSRATGPTRMRRDSGSGYSLFSAQLNNGDTDILVAGEEETFDWIVDAGGQAVARIDYDTGRKLREVHVPKGGTRYELLSETPEAPGEDAKIVLHGLSETSGVLLATSYGLRDKRALVEYDLATAAIGRERFSHLGYDIKSITYDPRTATVTGVEYVDDLPRAFHLDQAEQKLQSDLAAALPGAAPMIMSRSADHSRLLVRAIYTDHPDQIFLYDKARRSLSLLTPTYAGLDGKVLAAKEKYDYTASDGLRIPGYLTVPAGASRANMPLVVLPHGGPHGRDDQAFDWWSFFYAARGYLVYQPNFRGSDGYGYNFRSAGYGEWGRKMQDDITEGVKKLIADGLVDPARICIVGGSYGGYAALAGATLTPDLYACAVSVNGVSNLPGMMGETARSSELADDYWEVRLGSRFRDVKALNEVSPAKIAGNAGAPILLIHGKNDTVVPYWQSTQMRDALETARKPHEFVELPGEDHWLSRAESRTQMLAKSIEFIDRHIGSAAGAN